MPLPIYSSHGNDPKFQRANDLYDEAMDLAARHDKKTAIEKLEEAKSLLESCNEKSGLEIVENEIKNLKR
ncbi:MAG: hypothetical protein KME60_30080 [Cyanomargarita calcarea GSE-NOS-MK-12-04C]|jgi:hypothetical protein|uniref:Uncharacterized protein n=1 Tax=Cyanomargarita calcarea GSE-NOS-MK-12-04C TaxID=2839659 RepID=A0A951UW32_9CYAN|nr:hypothetical protein [Cyanomargarita calcarea GSE-NOS-MK-12-04C]